MLMLRSLVKPGWTAIIPGLAMCALFALVVMNIDHVLNDYHKADIASAKIVQLKQDLATANKGNVAAPEIQKLEKDIAKQQKALDNVGAKPGDSWSWATFLYQTLQFKYVAILLVGGILIRNILGVHKVFMPGVGVCRPLIKPGIIILGVHYIWSDVLKVGGTGLIMTSIFIFGTAITVMALCRRFDVPDGLGGILGAGTGVCGISAIIAISPVVKAKPRDMAYAIGTILLFGTLMLFVMPYLGAALDISQPQFGAWVAIAILNTAQLIAAAEWYGDEARDTAVLINAARIMLIPFIVIFAVWFYGLKGKTKEATGFWVTLRDKFPIFILGFFVLILLNSLSLDFLGGPKDQGTPFWAMNAVYKWFFSLGFAGIGLSISIDDMKKAGGVAFAIGSCAATAKMLLGLIAVLLVGAELLRVTSGH
ncbi:MAG: putative sulfate exporter family transporter [Proteobacteria bacterium]|nr:putative sulfate exporter family transporter [Pseudomonadota bacterium]